MSCLTTSKGPNLMCLPSIPSPAPSVKSTPQGGVQPPPLPPPPSLPILGPRSAAASMRWVSEVVEFYHSLMRWDSKRESCGGVQEAPLIDASISNTPNMIGEIKNCFTPLLAISPIPLFLSCTIGLASKPMKYDDPFNNPFVKIDRSSSTVEMFGKLYRLAPVTLTTEQKSIHQKRRSRVYQWKRPTVFLKEGDSIPPDIDPDTVRWIPANHPFATTVSDIDEDLAQSNVYQKDGVPFRVKAEHEAMQKKLQALQNQEQRFNEVAINLNNIRDFERPSQSVKPHEQLEQDSSIYQQNSLINEGVDSSADNHQRN
ncbi:hypothetical protein MUK42_35544 [Musa troglodytarum]|uniref:Protein MULTIPLE CHLOROPLAST DIVISION SITE 1 n=1 Tax=Musa troglodytarum TaxID=320322 RepID=A0A9E7FF33_9LILI|nr:hypothetical protein MUK42_35544 [Musa troglodytarum]